MKVRKNNSRNPVKLDDLPDIMRQTRAFAKVRGITPKDVKDAIKRVRNRKQKSQT